MLLFHEVNRFPRVLPVGQLAMSIVFVLIYLSIRFEDRCLGVLMLLLLCARSRQWLLIFDARGRAGDAKISSFAGTLVSFV